MSIGTFGLPSSVASAVAEGEEGDVEAWVRINETVAVVARPLAVVIVLLIFRKRVGELFSRIKQVEILGNPDDFEDRDHRTGQ